MSVQVKVVEKKENDQELDLIDEIDKAQEHIQAMMINSNFVKLTKASKINNKEVNRNINIDVKRLCQKLDDDKISLKELNLLKKVFYLTEDKDSEIQLYDAKVDSKTEIVKSLINIRRFNLSQNLQNKEIEKKVIEGVQNNLEEINENLSDGIGNQKGDVEVFQNDDVNIVVTEVKTSLWKEHKTFEKSFEPSKTNQLTLKIKNFISASDRKMRQLKRDAGIPLILNECMNIDEDSNQTNNQNNNVSNVSTNVYTKKQISNVFKQNALNKISQNRAQMGNFLMNRNKFSSSINDLMSKLNNANFKCESVIEALAKNNKVKPGDAWKAIQENLNNFNDMITPLMGLIKTHIDNAPNTDNVDLNCGINMAIVNCMAAIINKVGLLCNAITNLWQYTLNERQKEDFSIKIGNKSKKYEADALFKINRLAGYSNEGKFIQTNEWNKLSPFEKISSRFIFSDINQFPSFKTWKEFNEDQKITFLVKRITEFRFNRSKELCGYYDKLDQKNDADKIRLADMINKFIYYGKRDRNGNLILVSKELRKKVVEKIKDNIKDYNSYCNKLITILNEFSRANAVISIVKCRGKFYRCYGKDFSFLIDEKNFLKKTFKPKGRTYYKFRTGKHERQYYTKPIKYSQKKSNNYKKKLNYKYYNDFKKSNKSNSLNVNNNLKEETNDENFHPKEDEFAIEDDFVGENF